MDMKRLAVLLIAASTLLTAWGQAPKSNPKIVGKLKDVQGLVTVNSGDQAINAFTGAALVVGTRVVSSSSGAVTLSYDNGCDIKLKANESFVVKESSDCAALLALVGSVAVPAATVATAAVVAAPAVAAAAFSPLVAVGGVLAAGAVVANQNKDKLSGS